MRIAIDARPLHWPGIGRYIRELVYHLALVDKVNDYFIWVNVEQKQTIFNSVPTNIRFIRFRSSIHSINEQLEMTWRLYKDKIDLLHCPSSLLVPIWAPCTMVVTVHDMLFKSKPIMLSGIIARTYFTIINNRAINQASQIITVSDFTHQELLKTYPKLEHITATIHNGIAPVFSKIDNDKKSSDIHKVLGIQNEYIIAVGSLKTHKNFNRLVRAYARLKEHIRNKLSLVIVTSGNLRNPDTSLHEVIQELDLGNQVIITSDLSDIDLAHAYSKARAFISVSIYEGFGLPVAEAMACGTAIIASDIQVFHEVAEDAAVFVDPKNEQAITSVLEEIATDIKLVNSLKTKSKVRSRHFDWELTARNTLSAYNNAVQDKTNQ